MQNFNEAQDQGAVRRPNRILPGLTARAATRIEPEGRF